MTTSLILTLLLLSASIALTAHPVSAAAVTVTITNPSNGATLSTTDSVIWRADASSPAGIMRVNFYIDDMFWDSQTFPVSGSTYRTSLPLYAL